MNETQKRILALAKARNALILAHYYQAWDIQEIAHVTGDSFAMAVAARDAREDTLVVCGVSFMAETAKLLSPRKTVLHPAPDAGCPMADMLTEGDISALREKHPRAAVVCYVNSSAAVKAQSDICVTSSSAERVVRSLSEEEIIFVPDRNLGAFIASRVPEKRFFFFEGYCPIHNAVTAEDVRRARNAHPEAVVLVHPECRPEVTALADGVGSTSYILNAVEQAPEGASFIIGTEAGVIDRLRHTAPGRKTVLLRQGFTCVNMKKTRLEDVLAALDTMSQAAVPEPETAERARLCLDRMTSFS